jgi:cytochrome bd ubiquinol oxidase subunit I
MNYPVWVVPYLGTGWVIGILSIIHIFVSHFAVGGGIYLAITEHTAFKRQDERMYDYLKTHSRFFLLVTTVVGAVTGPGIWWAISLGSPNGTQLLIQNFTWFWSLEYLAFAAEIPTFFVYYYTWDRISRPLHLKLAWWYFGISICTLVLINGIITFMLTPGTWLESREILDGFFNPTYWPSNFLRLLIMFGLAGMYALITSSRIRDENFRVYMLRYSAKWLLPIFFLGPIVGYWYFANIPQAAIETIFTGIHASGVGNFSILARVIYLSLILSGTILIFAFVGPYLNPKGFSFRTALMFLLCGLLVTGISEWARELLRKPYVAYGYMYANGILVEDVPRINRQGFFSSARWAPQSRPVDGIGNAEGEMMFRYQCMSCHARVGYRGMRKLLGERDEESIRGFLETLRETDPQKNPYSGIMPPLLGHDDEVAALARYLESIRQQPAQAADF